MLKKFTTGMRRETEILYQMYGKAICAIAYKYRGRLSAGGDAAVSSYT